MRRADVRLVRAVCAVVATGVVWLAATPAAQAVDNPLSITVKVGYSGFIKTQQWMPVAIDVTNKGPDVEGLLEVNAPAVANGPPTGSAIYEIHVSLPSGTTKHLKTYLVEGWAPTAVSVRLIQNGKVVTSAASGTGSNSTALVGVLSDGSAALNNIEAQHPGGLRANVVHLSLEDVGDSAILLRAFDLLVIDDFATDTLTAAQRGAITDYVQNGGALLIGTGASWRKTVAGISATILPMRIGGTAILSSIGTLDKLSAVEVATGALNPGAQAWLSVGDTPLLAETLVGNGSVNLAAFDWNQEPVASWSGTNSLLRQVLVRTLFSSAVPPNTAMGKFGMTNGSVSGRSQGLSQALGSLPALDLPSLMVIGLLIVAYVLVVGPINYLALRALRRRALAWVTVPLIAVVASAGAFGTGVFTKGRSVQTNQVSIIHLQPGWDRAYEESYTGVVTPTRGDFEVKIAGSRTLIGPIVSFSGGYVAVNGGMGSSTTELIRVSSDNNTIRLPGMTAFVLRGFATEGLVDAPHLVVTSKFVNGNLAGAVRNDSNTTFTDAVVLAGDGFQKLPGLAPGASVSFDFTPKLSNPYGGMPAISTIYTNYMYGPQPSQPTDAEREAAEKTSILSLIASPNYYGYTAAIAPMVVAWTRQPAERIAVTGSQTRSTAETAVVAPIAIGAIGPGQLTAGLVVSRFTDIDGTTQSGPPGGVLMQKGTVSYAFRPTLAPGKRLTVASLDSTNQSLKGGFVVAPGSGPVSSPQAEVWDWAKSAWVSMDYQANGPSTLPPTAVDPSSSEVRLRLTVSGGQAILGSISLTGTVA